MGIRLTFKKEESEAVMGGVIVTPILETGEEIDLVESCSVSSVSDGFTKMTLTVYVLSNKLNLLKENKDEKKET